MNGRLPAFRLLLLVSCWGSLFAQRPPAATAQELDAAKREIERLNVDAERLRKERDSYRADLQARDTQVSAELKVVAAQLEKGIQEDFFSSVTRVLWLIAILAGVATFGGYWKLSDIINKEIARKIDDKEKDIQKLRDDVMQALIDFRMQAADAIKEVSERRRSVQQEAEEALTEFRSRRLEVAYVIDASGKQSAALAPSETAAEKKASRAVSAPATLTRIFAAAANQVAFESQIEGNYAGVFSHYFVRAFRDRAADRNRDGKISLEEAVAAARGALKEAGFNQTPEILGSGAGLNLFSVQPVQDVDRPNRRVVGVLLGINEYQGGIPPLQGPVNDVSNFRSLLEDRRHLLAREAVVHVLTDAEATYAGVEKELAWLRSTTSEEDLILFYIAGHTTAVADTAQAGKRIPVAVLHDSPAEGGRFLRLPDLEQELAGLPAREKVLILG